MSRSLVHTPKSTPTAPANPSEPMHSVSLPRRWGAALYLYIGVPVAAAAFVVGLVRLS